MRFTTALFLSGTAVLASAQTPTASAPTGSTTEQTAIIRCLDACAEGDVDCAAKCISVPNPNEDDANATNKCVADCPQGTGSATDNLNYLTCVEGCISKHYYTITTPGSAPTPASGSGSGNGDNGSGSGSGNGGSGTSNNGASGSGSAGGAATGAPGSGAGMLGVSGLLGVVAALLAL